MRGYGPLAGMIVAFVAMAALVPTVSPETVGTTGNAAVTVGEPPPGAVPCAGLQIPADPYSPPCLEPAGADNGGATAEGVDATTIKLSLRDTGPPYDIGSVFGRFSGDTSGDLTTSDDYVRTYETLVDYFNENFEFYGRRLELEVYDGQGSTVDEILGGGQANANADAIRAAQEVGAFADVSLQAPVFAEALQGQRVIAPNAFYPNREWFEERSPYAFASSPDCTKIVDFVVELVVKSLAGRPVAAGEFEGEDRRFGLVYPQSPIYQRCGDDARRLLSEAGYPPADYKLYTLSLDGIPSGAASITSQFANQEITTVVLISDPLMPFFMTSSATQSDWYPEWVNAGVAYTDADWAGQIYDQDQWINSIGVSLTGPPQPFTESDAYAAYQAMGTGLPPDARMVSAAYYRLYLLAVGVQMAGPELTPQTFADGLRRYESPEVGSQGKWGFPDGDFTAPQAARVIWWDPNVPSPYNDSPGAYQDSGEWYPLGELPEGEPPGTFGR